MGLVLAIDPGGRQGKALYRLTHDLAGHEIVVVSSCDEALDVLDTRLPDLLLFPLFFAPADEARLQARLRDLPTRSDVRALTIPLAACAEGEKDADRPTAVPTRWFYWFRPPTVDSVEPGNPQALASRVRAELQRPPSWPTEPMPHQVSWPQGSAVSAATFREPTVEVVTDSIASQGLSPDDPTPGLESEGDESEPRHSDVWARPDADWNSPTLPPLVAPPVQARVDDPLGRLVVLGSKVPRGLYLGVGAAVVLFTLGVSGRALMSFPTRWIQAARIPSPGAPPGIGTADLQSEPGGAQVFVGGRAVGVTPLRMELPAGEHSVEFRYGGSAQTVTLSVAADTTVAHRVEWKGVRASGSLKIESQPFGATVFIDGVSSGTTPLVKDNVAVGSHEVELKLGANSVRQTVEVKAGKTTTFDSGIYVGWLALFSPIELTVREKGRTLALDERNRVMLSAGSHELTLENRGLGFRVAHTVHITSGEVTAESLELPQTQVTITTSSPAEVWVDGTKAGETPLVDWPVEIGTREVVLRAAGRSDHKLSVTATVQPVHLSVDLP
jgi:hypothetical protein